jgi:hypothetical protein
LETVWKHAWNGDERKVIDTGNLPENLLLAVFPTMVSIDVPLKRTVKVHGFHGEPPISGMVSLRCSYSSRSHLSHSQGKAPAGCGFV